MIAWLQPNPARTSCSAGLWLSRNQFGRYASSPLQHLDPTLQQYAVCPTSNQPKDTSSAKRHQGALQIHDNPGSSSRRSTPAHGPDRQLRDLLPDEQQLRGGQQWKQRQEQGTINAVFRHPAARASAAREDAEDCAGAVELGHLEGGPELVELAAAETRRLKCPSLRTWARLAPKWCHG